LAAAHAAGRRPLATVLPSPYRGLRVFEEQDSAFFFGRETATIEVLERMSRPLEGTGLLVVSGVSGAGKSSLLRAGVLPRIRGGGLALAPGAASWPCVLLTPTRAPLDELALRVALLAGADAAAVRRGLDADPGWFALTARRLPWRGLMSRQGILKVPRRSGTSRRSGGCCWWWTSSRSCLPSARMRGSGRRSSPPCMRPPAPATGRIRHRRRWSCWVCALISTPSARTTHSWL